MAPTADAKVTLGKVALRREAKIATIVAAAWKLARRQGIAGLSSA